MNDEQSRAYLDQLIKLNPELGKFFTLTSKLNKTITQRIALDTTDNASKVAQKKAVDEFVKQIKFTGGDGVLGKFSKGLKSGFQDVSKFQSSLDALDNAIENTTDAVQKLELEKHRETAATKLAAVAVRGAAADMAMSIGKNAVGAIAGTAGKFVTQLQDNASATQISATLMSGAVDLAAGSASAAGKGISAAGGAMASFAKPGSPLQAAGLLVGLLGDAAAASAEGLGKLAKFGIEVLAKEVEKTVKAYNDMSAAGATFANGMTGMRNAALGAGLTVEQFSGVVTKHSTELASLGMSVGEGTKRIGGALKAGGDKMQTQLLKLGYSFQDQAGLVAETMKDMKGSSMGSFKSSNAAVAEQTQKYAENLRVISGITGEDAKKKMESVRQQAAQLGFQQKLAKMAPEQQASTLRAMSNMSDVTRKNFMDMVNFGSVINKEGAAMQAMSGGLANTVNETYDAWKNGNLDETQMRKINADNADQAKRDLLNNIDIGTAGAAGVGGLAGQLADSMGQELQFRNNWTKEAIAGAEGGVAAQKKATDDLTVGVMGAATAAQDLKVQLEKVLTVPIGKFAEVSGAMLQVVKDQLAQLGLDKSSSTPGKDPNEKSWWQKAGRGALEYGGMALGTAGGTAAGIGMGLPTAGIGALATPALAAAGGAGGSWLGSKAADLLGFANGGMPSGPNTGYPVMLHGTEAVVPLDAGRSIPVKISYPESAGSASPVGAAGGGNDLSGLMQQQINLMRELIGKSADQLDVFTTSRDIQQRLLTQSY